jgi:hypothetical protein
MQIRFDRRFLLPCALAFALGFGSWLYRGPGRAFVRGYLGDVFVVAFLYFLVGVAWRASIRARAFCIGLLAIAVELSQLVRHAPTGSTLNELTLGAFFDPYDLLAYALGLAAAVGYERYRLPPALEER